MVKAREDVTLEDVFRLKGSRWKSIIKELDNENHFVESVGIFINSVPECRKLRAYVFLDSMKEMLPQHNGDVLEFLFDMYNKLGDDVLESMLVAKSSDISIVKADIDIEKYEIVNPEYDKIRSNIEKADDRIDMYRIRIVDKLHDIHVINDSIAECSIRRDEDIASLCGIKEIVAIDVNDMINNFVNTCIEAEMIPLTISIAIRGGKPVLLSDIVIQPRLMYDVNASSRAPIMTQPIMVRIGHADGLYKASAIKGIRSHNRYDSYHPHISNNFICFGDAEAMYKNGQVQSDPSLIIKAIDSISRAYNSGSPFVTWYEHQRSLAMNGLLRLTKDKYALINDFIKEVMLSSIKTVRSSYDFKEADYAVFLPVKFDMSNILGVDLVEKMMGFDEYYTIKPHGLLPPNGYKDSLMIKEKLLHTRSDSTTSLMLSCFDSPDEISKYEDLLFKTSEDPDYKNMSELLNLIVNTGHGNTVNIKENKVLWGNNEEEQEE